MIFFFTTQSIKQSKVTIEMYKLNVNNNLSMHKDEKREDLGITLSISKIPLYTYFTVF